MRSTTRSSSYFGNVCAFDAKPVDLTEPKTLAMFKLFAELVGLQLDYHVSTSADLARRTRERTASVEADRGR